MDNIYSPPKKKRRLSEQLKSRSISPVTQEEFILFDDLLSQLSQQNTDNLSQNNNSATYINNSIMSQQSTNTKMKNTKNIGKIKKTKFIKRDYDIYVIDMSKFF